MRVEGADATKREIEHAQYIEVSALRRVPDVGGERITADEADRGGHVKLRDEARGAVERDAGPGATGGVTASTGAVGAGPTYRCGERQAHVAGMEQRMRTGEVREAKLGDRGEVAAAPKGDEEEEGDEQREAHRRRTER